MERKVYGSGKRDAEGTGSDDLKLSADKQRVFPSTREKANSDGNDTGDADASLGRNPKPDPKGAGRAIPSAGPHAKPALTNPDLTPGSGMFSETDAKKDKGSDAPSG